MRLAFGDQLRLEAAGAIARHRNPDLAILGQDRLRARPVPAVALAASGGIASLVAEMLGQLGAKRTLDQCLFELLEKTIGPRQILGLLIVSKQLIQQLRRNRRIGRHVSLLDKVNSQKPAYTFFLTPSSDVNDSYYENCMKPHSNDPPRSRCSRRASSSATLGMRTTLHTF